MPEADPAELDVCYLTTTGRRSGRPHTIEIWFALREGRAYLLAGDGDTSDWVRNLRADPHVTIRIGGREDPARAREIADPDEDRLARELVFEKYAPRYSGDLREWRRTALAVAIDLPAR